MCGRADDEIGDAIGVEIADRQRRAEGVVGGEVVARDLLGVDGVAVVEQAGGRAEIHLDHACVRPEDRTRVADREIGAAIAVEVADREWRRGVGLRVDLTPWQELVAEGSPGSVHGQTGAGAVQDADADRTRVPDRRIRHTVAVEVGVRAAGAARRECRRRRTANGEATREQQGAHHDGQSSHADTVGTADDRNLSAVTYPTSRKSTMMLSASTASLAGAQAS